MSHTVNAYDHEEWHRLGLQEYESFSDCINECNMEDIGDCTDGEWYYIPEQPLPNGDRVIYTGTWGNYNAPGASSYTYAEVFSPEEEAEFLKQKAGWESQEEWLPDDDEEDYDCDDELFDEEDDDTPEGDDDEED